MEDFDKGKGTNCCGMTALALGIGGLSAFATPPSNTVYQGSRTLIEWVEKAVKKINTLNEQRKLIRSSAEYTNPNLKAWSRMPGLETWTNREDRHDFEGGSSTSSATTQQLRQRLGE
jgi:hypothetical protein